MQDTAAVHSTSRELLTVRQFAQAFPAWTSPALRALIYASQDRVASGGRVIRGNGLLESGALVFVGRRVLLDVQIFFGPWLFEQQKQRRGAKAAA